MREKEEEKKKEEEKEMMNANGTAANDGADAENARGVGRPRVWETAIKPKIAEIGLMVAHGLRRKEIATQLGISIGTFRNYERLEPELRGILCAGRVAGVEACTDSLFKLARGAKVKTTKKKTYDDGRTVVEEIEEELAPNLAAIEKLMARLDSVDSDSPEAQEADAMHEQERERIAAMSEAEWRRYSQLRDRLDFFEV